MLTGWQYTGGKWYYLNSDGAMKTGWLKLESEVEDTSATSTDNIASENKTSESGQKTSEDQNAETTVSADKTEGASSGNTSETKTEKKTKKVTKWYYLNTDGAMVTGWLNSGSWYYLNSDGAMHTGWLIDNNSKYYLNESGEMVTGTQTIDGKEYKFASSGALIN